MSARLASRPALVAMAMAAVLATWLAAGCGQDARPQYTVRGVIENLAESRGKPVVLIHHEAIPSFVDGYGEQRTMPSMAMAFGLEPGVSMDGVAVGDKIEVTFLVDRERYPTFHITSLRKLAPDTTLTLSR